MLDYLFFSYLKAFAFVLEYVKTLMFNNITVIVNFVILLDLTIFSSVFHKNLNNFHPLPSAKLLPSNRPTCKKKIFIKF